MSFVKSLNRYIFFITGNFFLFMLFCPQLYADTLILKNGKYLKGLVVEEHEDRIILSTENGEIPILRRGIEKIDFDDPSQNFVQLGRAYESKQRWGEALGYYEKALELKPDMDEAKKAVVRIRNNFWAKSSAGPVNEIEKKQELYETWGRGAFSESRNKVKAEQKATRTLEENLGIRLIKKGDWVRLSEVSSKKDAALAGLRRDDHLVAVDGNSLRYLNVDVVAEKMTTPRFSSFTLEYDRETHLRKNGSEKDFKKFGFQLKLDSEGVVVESVRTPSAASKAGLREGDLLVEVDGTSMRYLPLNKLMDLIQKNKASEAIFVVRRSALLARR